MSIARPQKISHLQKQALVFIGSLFVLSVYLSIFWPGLTTVDQYFYLKNIVLDPIPIADLDYESFLFGILNWALLSQRELFWQIILQIGLASFAISYAFRLQLEHLRRPNFAYFSLLFLVLNPFHPQFVLLTERDILFGLIHLIATLKFTKIILQKNKPTSYSLFLLSFLFLFAAGIRREGLFFVALLPFQIYFQFRDLKLLQTISLQLMSLFLLIFFLLPLPFPSQNQIFKATSGTNVLGLKHQIFPVLERRESELSEYDIEKIRPFLQGKDQRFPRISKLERTASAPTAQQRINFMHYAISIIIQNPGIYFATKTEVLRELLTLAPIDYYRPPFIIPSVNEEIKNIRIRLGWKPIAELPFSGSRLLSFSDWLASSKIFSFFFCSPYLAFLLCGLAVIFPVIFSKLKLMAYANFLFFFVSW